jgi:hypothetical protein
MKRRNTEAFLRKLWAMETALVGGGLPPMPAWWRKTIERFYRSGKRRLVVRKGRRVFASTCIAPRLAVAEMLFGEHPHMPGTPPLVYAFLSVKREEAAKRLRGITAILDLLQQPFSERGETVELRDLPAAFAVVTANHKTSVGDTVAFAWCDEVSRWSDDEIGANPADRVVGSLAPALATLPDAKLFLVSSPLTNDDYHARQFELGETSTQAVAFGATWEVNPTLTEEMTHELEPDHRTWSREYAAQPSEAIAENWFGSALDSAISAEPPPAIEPGVRPIIAIDPAFAKDRFGYAVVTSRPGEPDPVTGRARRRTFTHVVGAWKAEQDPRGTMRRLREEICNAFYPEPRGLPRVYTDQAEYYSLREIALDSGINLQLVSWTGGEGEGSKLARFRAVRLAMRQGEFRIPNDPALVKSFRTVRGVLLPSGNERIETPRTAQGHGDDVSALVLAGSVALDSSPSAPRVTPTEVTEMQLHRAAAVKRSELKRLHAFRANHYAAMRKAMGMERR